MEEKLKQKYSDCLKIVFFGPESTGKTTLAKKLAEHFNTAWAPESSRGYLQEKWNKEKKICEKKDIIPIATEQMRVENMLAEKADPVLFCDTNLLQTMVYSQAYYDDFCDPELHKYALKAKYDLYFLTYIDVPWVADDLRDRPEQREEMFIRFKSALDQNELPYVILKGNPDQRFARAVKEVEKLLKLKKLDFNKEEALQLEEKGIKPEEAERQLNTFKRGNIVVNIREAATLRNGISVFSAEEKEQLRNLYQSKKDRLNLLKFIPASGAATRMFKALYKFLDQYDPEVESLDDFIERSNLPKLEIFFRRMRDLPFFEKIKKRIEDFDTLAENEQQLLFVRTMLSPEAADMGNTPKGLVPFHKYDDHLATAFEEHLREAPEYASSDGMAKLHFTVAKEQLPEFRKEFKSIRDRLKEETGTEYEVSFSFQDPKTDTIAVNENNQPVKDEQGKLFFRPGGHGALIDNLNKLKPDIIFIKNIDNVVVPKFLGLMAENKQMLAGKLLQLQEKIFMYLRKLENKKVSEEILIECFTFMQEELHCGLSFDFGEMQRTEKISLLKRKLNRPLRVCGMVRNEGEPGGGPFWVTGQDGEISLQIVESSQIDHDNYQQSKIAQEATHFNPVDIVCGLKDYKGEKFDLLKFVDPNTSFISYKTRDGQKIKALELPGLWNGGMSDWISIFIEVPLETFNPVKTVADLLKSSHQVQRIG